MAIKKTFEEIKSFFEKQGCELLENVYVNSKSHMKYKCVCGRTSTIAWNMFLRGRRCRECAKEKIEGRPPNFKIDGIASSDHPVYTSWIGMRKRCYYKKGPAYYRYGGRGISICKEWDDFIVFYQWSVSNGWTKEQIGKGVKDRLSLDRIDNDGNYCPQNCRWSTYKEQANNKSINNLITIFGETKNLTQWSNDERCIVSIDVIRYRISKGWNLEEAITTESRKYKI